MSILQGGVSGKVETRELFVAVMNGFGSIRVLYQRVIALPMLVRLLMKLHFDFDTFVDGLNHRIFSLPHRLIRMGKT